MDGESRKKRYNTRSKKREKDKEMKKKNHSNDNGNGSGNNNDDDEEINALEYKKFLKKLFPSSHMDKSVEDLEKKNAKDEEDDDDDEEFIPYDECSLSELKGELKLRGIKYNNKSKDKKKLISILEKDDKRREEEEDEDDDYETVDEEDSDEEDEEEEEDEYESGGQFNIVFTIGGPVEDEDEDDDEDEDEDDEDEDDEDEDDEDEDEDESDVVVDNLDETDKEKNDKNTKNKCYGIKSPKNKKSSEKEKKKQDKEVYYKSEIELVEKFNEMAQKLKEENKDSEALKEIIDYNKDQKKYLEKEQKKTEKKKREKNIVNFKKSLKDKGDVNELTFFKKLSVLEQKKIISQLNTLNKLVKSDKPYRMQLLESDIPDHFKACALKKISALRYIEPGGGEYYKMKNWVDMFMRIPFNKYENIPMTISQGIDKCGEFMEKSMSTLNDAVYGMDDAKMQIMQMIGQWISNPSATGTSIAIKGPPGTGKTTLVKEGISKILNRPFAFIALGGATDSSFLEGHGYTYEGSTPGKIVDILIKSKCMNPVIYFDEVDKISETAKGEEIVGILTHLTDTSQNDKFHDKYFSELDFDLNKCLFIFSYNDDDKVNPILKDRMYKINTNGYDSKEKVVIAEKHLLPKIKNQVKFNEEDVILPTSCIEYIIEKFSGKEDGVRNLKRCLEIIYTKINLYRLMPESSSIFSKKESIKVEFPFTFTNETIDKLLKPNEKAMNESLQRMYL